MSALVVVEEHTISLGSSDTSGVANLAMASIDNAVVTVTSARTPDDDLRPRFCMPRAYLTAGSPNTVTVARGEADGRSLVVVVSVAKWNTDYVIANAYTDTLTGGGSLPIAISTVDTSKAWIATTFSTQGSQWVRAQLLSEFTDVDEVTLTDLSDGDYVINIAVLEDVDGGIWDVQHVSADASQDSLTDMTLASSVTMSKTFTVGTMAADRNDRNADEVGPIYLSDEDTITQHRFESGGGHDVYVRASAITLLQAGSSVQRGSFDYSGAATTASATIDEVDTDYAWAHSPCAQTTVVSSTDTNDPDSFGTLSLTSSTSVGAEVGENNGIVAQYWEVPEFEAPGGGPAPPTFNPLMMGGPF